VVVVVVVTNYPDHTITTLELLHIQFITSYYMFWSIIDSYAT